MMKRVSKERVFSVELKSKHNLKNLALTNSDSDNVLVEGTIGELVAASFTEGVILEIIGEKGTLRVDLEEEEIQKKKQQNSSEVNSQ